MTASVSVRNAPSLEAFIGAVRAQVDEALERYLPAPPDCPPLVAGAMRYSLFAGGKRLRPILTVAAADAVARQRAARAPDQGSPPADLRSATDLALPAACAIELIHTYSLIHDDLPAMDDDTLRRGRPTLHVVYGEGIAVLAGDALQAEAFALLAREPMSSDASIMARKLHVAAIVSTAAGSTGMVGGQTIDLQAAGQVPGHEIALDGDALEAMHRRKTGALISAAAVSGAIMAGGSEETLSAVERWAAEVGLAFQIVDDVLDVEGHAGSLGKTAGKDAAASKPTYPALYGVQGSRVRADACATRARATLAQAGLSDGWLDAIADWVVTRTS
jgi:geranylgeranyl pyrophosphate synthase